MPADSTYITETLSDLVRTKSINPAFSDGEPSDEREIATRLGEKMRALGMETTEYEAAPGRVRATTHVPERASRLARADGEWQAEASG